MNDLPSISSASRVRRGAAAVIAQYIQDLTSPVVPAPCVPTEATKAPSGVNWSIRWLSSSAT